MIQHAFEFVPTQIKAYENGATIFIVPIDKLYNIGIDSGADKPFYNYNIDGEKKYYGILDLLPVQKGDKDIFVENTQCSFNECINVRVIRIQDWMKYLNTKNKKAIESFTFHVSNEPISQKRRRAFESFYNQQLKEQNINRTYEDNDYVFLVEFKR